MAFSDLQIAIMDAMTFHVPLYQVRAAYRNVADFDKACPTLKAAYTSWLEHQPGLIRSAVEVWLADLQNLLDGNTLNINQPRNLNSFTVGKVSQTFRDDANAGAINWYAILPNSNLALFYAIPVDWRAKSRGISW